MVAWLNHSLTTCLRFRLLLRVWVVVKSMTMLNVTFSHTYAQHVYFFFLQKFAHYCKKWCVCGGASDAWLYEFPYMSQRVLSSLKTSLWTFLSVAQSAGNLFRAWIARVKQTYQSVMESRRSLPSKSIHNWHVLVFFMLPVYFRCFICEFLFLALNL